MTNATISLPIPATRRKRGKFLRTIVCPILHPWELSIGELAQFDYLLGGKPNTEESWMESESSFFKYRGEFYDMGDFVRIVHPSNTSHNSPFCHYDHSDTLRNWDGIATDSYFSGIVVKYLDDETIRAALYCC